ncbi:MAG: methyltransferase domain-containing protein, partial [Flavobacteriaceae bacterium]|nr:methyltransferase domain-containing protein [Flavobacteriaceae bacterium]
MSFDKDAKDWDKDPKKVERAKIFAKEINDFIKPNGVMKAMEFGCGTGLLSYELKEAFHSITLVDNSQGMIEVLQEKIENDGIKNFIPVYSDLLEEDLNQN